MMKDCRRLRFNFGNSGFLLATIIPNGTLHLDFHSQKYESPTSPYYFRWEQIQVHLNHPHFSTVSPFMFIRCLHLIAVTSLTSEAVSSMLSEFHFLDSMIIRECHGLRALRIRTHYHFLKLIIFNCLQLKCVYISSDQIYKFWYRGLLPRFIYESCRDTHSLGLADAMLDFRGGPSYHHFTCKHSQSLLSAIESAQILTLCRWTFEVCFLCLELLDLLLIRGVKELSYSISTRRILEVN